MHPQVFKSRHRTRSLLCFDEILFFFFITKILCFCFNVPADRLSGWHLYLGSYYNCNLISLPRQVWFRWIINPTALCPHPLFCISLPVMNFFISVGDRIYFPPVINATSPKVTVKTATGEQSILQTNIDIVNTSTCATISCLSYMLTAHCAIAICFLNEI